MTFVHVIDGRLASQGREDFDSADAEDGFLTEAIESIAAVEVVSQLPVPTVIGIKIRIQEDYGNHMAIGADNVFAPGANHYGTALDANGG